MRFRKLRIAWSVICGIACVLLIVLWVQGYWSFSLAFMQSCMDQWIATRIEES
jgi:hypothetical protein